MYRTQSLFDTVVAVGSEPVRKIREQQFHKRLQGQKRSTAAPTTAQNSKFALGFKPRTDYEVWLCANLRLFGVGLRPEYYPPPPAAALSSHRPVQTRQPRVSIFWGLFWNHWFFWFQSNGECGV